LKLEARSGARSPSTKGQGEGRMKRNYRPNEKSLQTSNINIKLQKRKEEKEERRK
jgi:hypothetical protein